MPAIQGRYWILTIPHQDFTPFLPQGIQWIRGQLEQGEQGFLHWQIVVSLPKKKTLAYIKTIFGERCHGELSRSSAADEYVWKEDTRVQGTQFELGQRQFKRNDATDWEKVWESAKKQRFEEIPADIRIRYYHGLRSIGNDYNAPIGMERTCRVYWGPTGTGKSRRAWEEAGMEAYPKDPRTKWWTGYRGASNVVVDEFRGGIDISHMLRWLDRYPVNVETKGGSIPLAASNIWITSNIHPRQWYPDLDNETMEALLRRLEVTQFHNPL